VKLPGFLVIRHCPPWTRESKFDTASHCVQPGIAGLFGQSAIYAFKGVEAMINSMTPFERANPDVIETNRRKRIAKGSGKELEEVNAFMKQFDQMKQMMKMMNKMPMGGKMGFGRR